MPDYDAYSQAYAMYTKQRLELRERKIGPSQDEAPSELSDGKPGRGQDGQEDVASSSLNGAAVRVEDEAEDNNDDEDHDDENESVAMDTDDSQDSDLDTDVDSNLSDLPNLRDEVVLQPESAMDKSAVEGDVAVKLEEERERAVTAASLGPRSTSPSSTPAPTITTPILPRASNPEKTATPEHSTGTPKETEDIAPYVPQFTAAAEALLGAFRDEPSTSISAAIAIAAASAPGIAFQPVVDEASSSISVANDGMSEGKALKKRKRQSVATSNAANNQLANAASSPLKNHTPKSSSASSPNKTRSGRQVLKPMTYNPSVENAISAGTYHLQDQSSPYNTNKNNNNTTTPMSAAHNTIAGGGQGGNNTNNNHKQRGNKQRTVEQALCKTCTRMHSPASNQIVFCDGCDGPWHQRCHAPMIRDEVVRDEGANWFCGNCVPRPPKGVRKKKKSMRLLREEGLREAEVLEQKRKYFTSLTHDQVFALLAQNISFSQGGKLVLSGKTIEAPLPAPPHAPADFEFMSEQPSQLPSHGADRPVASTTGASISASPSHGNADMVNVSADDKEDSPLPLAWPKAGKGLYASLPLEADDDRHLVDDDDALAFQVVVFRDKIAGEIVG